MPIVFVLVPNNRVFNTNFTSKGSICGSRLHAVRTPNFSKIFKVCLYEGNTTVISSPGFPVNYSANYFGEWKLLSTAGGFLLNFTSFDTEYGYDFLYIYSGVNTSVANYEKTLNGRIDIAYNIYVLEFPYLLLQFISDYSIQESGFRVEITAINVTSHDICERRLITVSERCNFHLFCKSGLDEADCGELVSGQRLEISSSSFPYVFHKDDLYFYREWRFAYSGGYQVNLTLLNSDYWGGHLDIETSKNQRELLYTNRFHWHSDTSFTYAYDTAFLRIVLRFPNSRTRLESGNIYYPLQEFHADILMRNVTSLIDCSKVCRIQLLTNPRGEIGQNSTEDVNLGIYFNCICEWNITVDNSYFIKLNITFMNLPCDITPLEIFSSGKSVSSGSIGSVCGYDPRLIISDGNTLLLRLQVSTEPTGYGFRAFYEEIDKPGCGTIPSNPYSSVNLTCTTQAAFIASANYLQEVYDIHTYWHITTSQSTYIEVHFLEFDLYSETSYCEEEYLEFQMESSTVRLCNMNLKNNSSPFLSDKNELTIELNIYGYYWQSRLLAFYKEKNFISSVKSIAIRPNLTCMDLPHGERQYCYCLFIDHKNISWIEASAACRHCGNGSYLATIRSQRDMDFLQQLILQEGEPLRSTYIGLIWDDEKERHKWTDGDPLSFSSWRVSRSFSSNRIFWCSKWQSLLVTMEVAFIQHFIVISFPIVKTAVTNVDAYIQRVQLTSFAVIVVAAFLGLKSVIYSRIVTMVQMKEIAMRTTVLVVLTSVMDLLIEHAYHNPRFLTDVKRHVNDHGRNSSDSTAVTIHDAVLRDLKDFPFLLRLDLSGSNIQIIRDGDFQETTNLKHLYLDRNNITTINEGSFQGLDKLKYLDLSGNPLTMIGERPFKPLKSLEILYSDKFYFCCLEFSPPPDECYPRAGQFSGCHNLMRNTFLRMNLWLLGIAAVFGNGFVLIFRICRRDIFPHRDRNPAQAILIFNLAIADFLIGIYMLIIAGADLKFQNVYYQFSEHWQTSSLCKFAGFLSVVGSEASVMFLTVITVDRFQGVVFPFSRKKLRFKSTLLVAGCVWTLAIIISGLPLIPFPYFGESYYGRSSVCLALPLTPEYRPGWLYSIFVFLVFNFLSFSVMLVCYVIIYVKASKSLRFRGNVNSMSDRQVQIAMRMFFLVFTDMACWMPVIIMGMLSQSRVVTISGEVYAWTAVLILPVNSALNPYLYTFFIKATRRKSQSVRSHSRYSQSHQTTVIDSRPSVQDHVNAAYNGKDVFTDLMSDLISDFRRNHLIVTLMTSTVIERSLTSLRKEEKFSLSRKEKENIKLDVKKGVNCLHDNYIIHGRISPEYVIIDESPEEEARAFLLFTPLTTVVKGNNNDDSFEILKEKDLRDLERIFEVL
ncbi:hypothetical protein HOLleu_32124 [Holothuria leucospilota]|uniref:G-protein coupled receptor GRL101 n=1 Tax=Holothuria leucospilota TaxID=206669 RepID=A0A9Q0YTV3_HOLLE|nr:hypothetical protein HOLleu_32124 [Holothuria leucospilota]